MMMVNLNKDPLTIFLADDDLDDCAFFNEALEELEICAKVITAHNGEQLMKLLQDTSSFLPDVLFLDLNMPRKSGFQCLEEIRQQENLKDLPVIIYSTSYDEHIVGDLKKNGANHFIRKPTDFSLLKRVIHQALSFFLDDNYTQPVNKQFVLGNTK